jgi:hypothetical protein
MADTMENTLKIIKSLESLNFSKYPYQEVKDLIGSFGPIGAIIMTLHPGKVIMRARPNYDHERFNKVSQISYKPAEYNKTYQRASTPYNTMFYGSTIFENIKPGELNMTRVIGLFEAIPLMRDKEASGEQVITYSKWLVTKDIPLLSIIHHKDFQRENSYASEQRANFEGFLANHPKEVGDKARLVTDFLANQYAKDITTNDYDYLISAIYAEMTVVNGLAAGVFYPSVRTGGEGFNVAIHPHYIDNGYLIPEAVAECTIYKRGKNTIVDNETSAIIMEGQTEFELKPVLPEYHEGRENIQKKLYPGNY